MRCLSTARLLGRELVDLLPAVSFTVMGELLRPSGCDTHAYSGGTLSATTPDSWTFL